MVLSQIKSQERNYQKSKEEKKKRIVAKSCTWGRERLIKENRAVESPTL